MLQNNSIDIYDRLKKIVLHSFCMIAILLSITIDSAYAQQALVEARQSIAEPELLTTSTPAPANENLPVSPLDNLFVALRRAALSNDATRAQELSNQLQDYPEQAYVDYFRLRSNLYDGSSIRKDIPDREIEQLLNRYPKEAISDRLRNDWLLSLGKRRDWRRFDEQYPRFVLNDDVQLKCYAVMSKLSSTNKTELPQLYDQARKLMLDEKYFGEACMDLASELNRNKLLSRNEVRMLARWALEQKQTTLARHLASTTGIEEADNDKLAALTLVARSDPEQALAMLNNISDLSSAEQGAAWGVVGQFLAKKMSPQASYAFKRQTALGGDDLLSPQSYAMKIRSILLTGDWPWLLTTFEAMSPNLRERDPAWAYWYARALRTQGKDAAAQEQYRQLANQFHFYGLLAREELGQRITTPPGTPVSEADVLSMQNRAGFKRARKFYALGLRFEGGREWNWELRGMTDHELLAAAEYARRINLLDRTVSTADRTRHEHNFSLRYIMPHESLLRDMTQKLGLDMAWVYGLIRQESRFITNARSSVGAAGLMQVMPNTARYVARKIRLANYSHGKIDSTETNILLGVNYLNMVLNDMDGSWPLASAAYNAGPRRVKNWREALPRDVEGAIFAEAIPFDETRNYVKNVLANATLYSALITNQPQSVYQRLGSITRKKSNPEYLP